MKNQIFVAVLAGAVMSVSCASLSKMKKRSNEWSYKVTPEVLSEIGGNVDVRIDAIVPLKYFNKKAVVTATPYLVYPRGNKEYEPITMQGERIQGNAEVVPMATGKTVTYTGSVPYIDAMRASELYVSFSARKGSKTVEFQSEKIADGIITTAKLAHIDPKVVEAGHKFEKVTTETKEAALYYLINSAEIRASESGSAKIMSLNDFLKESSEDEGTKIQKVEIKSYASPDGTMAINEKVSQNRENASSNLIVNNMRKEKIEEYKNADLFKKYVVAEDWDGFREELEASDIPDKDLILRVLSMYSDPEVREREIKNIASAYSSITDVILPKLRRSKYVVTTVKNGKNDDDLRAYVKMRIADLNLEELLYAATLYDDVEDKLAILEVAQERYPKDWRAFNDEGVLLYNLEFYTDAREFFEKANNVSKNNPVIMNNLGAVALQKEEIQKASDYFGAATDAGEVVNYNKGILSLMNGNYDLATQQLANSNSSNEALANILTGSYAKASSILSNSNNSAADFYIKAVLAARNNDADNVVSNLTSAINMDNSYKSKAATDVEFIKYLSNNKIKALLGI